MIFRYKTLTLLWAMFIMVLTFTPGPSLPPLPHWEIISFDTFVHAVIFAVLIFLMINALKDLHPQSILKRYAVLSAFLISSLYGFFIEIIQPYIPGRTFEYYDILSNMTGCILGLLFFFILSLFKTSPN